MVFSSVVTTIINRFLSPFVDELSASQLNIFGWSGQVSLTNVSVKPNAFDALKLPFRIVHGHIGLIDASVPWMNIYAEPIVIKVSDIYVLALPNSEIVFNEEDEKYFEWALKKSYLENIENLKQKIKDKGKKEDDGFFMKLLVAAIKNIQIFISNVHVVYEDSTTYKKNVFQVGASFSRLVFETELNKKSENDLIHKLVKLEGFSLYLNSKKIQRFYGRKFDEINEILKNRISMNGAVVNGLEYILCPINFITEAAIHRKPEADGYKIPIVDLNMNLDYFCLQLTNSQVQTLLLFIDTIDRMKSAAPYRKWKPNVTIKKNPIMWWKFLLTATFETGFRKKKREFSWRSIEESCRKRKAYKELYKRKLLCETVYANDLETFEKELNLTSIVMARSQADAETKKILESKKVAESSKGWWFSRRWSLTADDQTTEALNTVKKEFKKEFNAQEKTKLYKAIGYQEDSQLLYPAEFIGYRLKFKINMLKVVVKNDSTCLLNIEFDKCNYLLLHRPSSMNIFIQAELDRLTIIGVNGVMLLKGRDGEKQFLVFMFEMNPLDKQSDFAVNLKMKSAYLLYDIETINRLCTMIKPPDSLIKPPESLTKEEIQSYAQYKLTDLKQMTSLDIEFAIEQHKQLKLDIMVEPSYVIIPKAGNIFTADAVVLISLGKVYLTSKLVPKSNIRKVRHMMASKTDVNTMMEEMRKLVYEKYNVHIQNVQLVLSDATHWKSDIDSLDTERHMICPFEVMLHIGRSIVPQDPHFAKVMLVGDASKIEIKASDPQICTVLGLLINLPFGPTVAIESDHLQKTRDASTNRTIHASKNLKINKMNTQNNQMAEAYSYATKAAEDQGTAKSSQDASAAESVVTTSGETKSTPQKKLAFEFNLANICVSIYAGDRRPESALGRCQVVKLAAKGEIFTNSDMFINCSLDDLLLEDIRTFRKDTGIRTMLAKPSSSEDKSKSFLVVKIAQQGTERAIVVALAGFTFTLALDYILSIVDVATKAFNIPVKAPPASISTSQLSQSVEPEKAIEPAAVVDEIVNCIELDVGKINVIMMQSLDVLDALACVFHCFAKVNLSLSSEMIAIKGGVYKIALGVANYMAYINSDKMDEYIMSPMEIELIGNIKGIKQSIIVTISDINIIISPQLVNIILGIVAALGSANKAKAKDVVQSDSADELLVPKPIDRTKMWFLNSQPVTKKFDQLKEVPPENQVIKIRMGNIKVLIKSNGLHAQPLIRFSMKFIANMIDSKRVFFDFTMLADYFNTALLAWEPLIEPVNEKPFGVQGIIDIDDTSSKVQLETAENLEVLLTKSSISAFNIIGTAFTSALTFQQGCLDKFTENRVIIRNTMGISMVLDVTKSNVAPAFVNELLTSKKSCRSLIIKSGEEVDFTTENMAMVELYVSLKFTETLVIERKIICSISSTRCYFTSIKTYPVNENWKWIVQVHDKGTKKEIDFRSNMQIVNHFDNSFIIYSYDGKVTSVVGKIGPLAQLNLPVQLVYSKDLLYIRPSTDFQISDCPVDWRAIYLQEDEDDISLISSMFGSGKPRSVLRYLAISCAQKSDKNKLFNMKVCGEKVNVLYEDTERLDNDESHIYNVKLLPLVRLKNLLPYAVEYNYDPMELEVVRLESGEEKILAYANFGVTHITYKVLHYFEQDWICTAILPEFGSENENHYLSFKAMEGDEKICLAVNYCVEKNCLNLSIFAPFWMVNHTQEHVIYKIDSEHIFRHPKSLGTSPFLLAFDPSAVSMKDKLSLSVRNSSYSEYFPLNVVPYNGSFLPQSATKTYTLYVNVQVELGRIGLSKIVIVSSFYNVFNISKKDIEYSENGEDWFTIGSECSKAFFPRKTGDQTMCFRFAGAETASKHVSLRSSSQTLLPMRDRYLFVEVDVTEIEAKIKISDYFYGTAPVLIVNDLSKPIYYGQKGVIEWNAKQHVSILLPRHYTFFCWLDPLAPREFVYRLPGDEKDHEVINFDFDKFYMIDETCGWVTFFDGKQRVLVYTYDPYLPQHLLKTEELTKPNLSVEITMKGIGVNLVNNEKKIDLLYLTICSTCTWEERSKDSKQFKALSIKENAILEKLYRAHRTELMNNDEPGHAGDSHNGYEVDFSNMLLIQPRLVHLRRISNRGLWFLYSQSAHITQCHMKVNRIQIDNQLPDHIFDVAFSPVMVPKSIYDCNNELQQKSFIEFSAIIQSLGSVTRYKYLQVLIQEFMVQVDWGWISAIIGVFDFQTTKEESPRAMIARDLEAIMKNNALAEMQKFVMRKTYYDYLLFGPLKAHISVSVGDLHDGKFPLGLDVIIRFTGLTLGEINDTLIKLDYFERKLLLTSDAELIQMLINHYKMQVFAQLYKLILGLDIIGNPMKLVLGIQKGIGDLFYEPAMGIILGPEEFAEGIATGVKSLALNVIGGTAGALGRIGNRLGTGVAALTVDEKFQKERRERINRKKGFAESGKNLLRGFVDGITGVVTKTIEGTKEEGIGGFFKGVGKGVVGIVVQPATGVIDFAAGSLHAFNEVIDPKEVAKPVRPPRHFPSGQELTAYVLHAAQGNQLLRNLSEGKYAAEDEYDYHQQLSAQSMVLLTKQKLFNLKTSFFTSAWEPDWIEDWSNCEKVTNKGKKLQIRVREAKTTICFFPGTTEQTIAGENEGQIRDLYENIKRHIKKCSAI